MNARAVTDVERTVRRLLALALVAAIACSAPQGQIRQRVAPEETPTPSAPPRRASPSPAPSAAERPLEDAIREPWLVWTLGGVPASYVEAIRRLPDVRALAVVRSGTLWARRFGTHDDFYRPPRGLRVPLEVAAIDPDEYASVFGGRVPPPLEHLVGADALAGRTWASLHGLRPDAVVLFDGGGGAPLSGVVDDALVGGHELVVVRRVGAAYGISEARYVLVRVKPEARPRAVARRLGAAAPTGVPVRIRAPGDARYLRHGDLTLPQSRLKALFGEFAAAPSDGWLTVEEGWVRRNIVKERVPILGEIECHRRIVPIVRGALRELVQRGLGRLIHPEEYGGCYAPRFLLRDASAGLSHHAWGVAIDINVASNPLGAEPTMDPLVVRTFERWGFVWGGRFLRPDGHHFEFRCFPSRCQR